MSFILDLYLVGVAWLHALLAPYTKVEESFSLHATHDVLMYGYDHRVFPGAVPRTFIGNALLAWMTSAVAYLASPQGMFTQKADVQVLVRLVLATVNAIALCLLRRAVSRRFGRLVSWAFVALTISQFHLPFWMGRTLPNMFALFPVNIALYQLVNRSPNSSRLSSSAFHRMIALLTCTAAIFRSEVALLLAPLALQGLLTGSTTFSSLLRVGVISGTCSAALTTLVDSYFWQQWPLWPELHGVFFNVIEGKSAEWGVSPWHTYFTSSLSKLLMWSFPLSVLGFHADSRVRALLLPYLGFIALLSCLGHKEWRFIIYVVPVFNIAAARGVTWIVRKPKSKFLVRLSILVTLGLIACNFVVTSLSTLASMNNYPGGEALSTFNAHYANETHVHVHISNLAAQTGASLFLHAYAPPFLTSINLAPPTQHWVYDKTENLTPQMLSGSKEVTHVIAESDGTGSPLPTGFSSSYWTPVASIPGFDGWKINPRLRELVKGRGKGLMENLDVFVHPLEMILSEKLVILERKGH
ncbi:Alg9-like mannosyltransferase family-domain-containing protein [Fomitopsis serialis]|uniref:Alg9-like mannosyltransferase family-domain-containing protein n=1 Tax=Fomitopsis serialis TaxID=139415 RepID=UPI0020076491|nr:Alg9-like mannosyltransferase family-domain-containing protein [Neoantrodia serialis]KAH9928344.1 Alg9-like mannosyltransferase family-domain-containing protein [Neoantrodia serialis]